MFLLPLLQLLPLPDAAHGVVGRGENEELDVVLDDLLFKISEVDGIDAVFADQIAAGGQHRPGALGQIGVLEEGRVIPARGQDHVDAAGVHVVHDAFQHLGIVPVVDDAVVEERRRGALALELPGDHGVGGAGGHPQVVLQNVPAIVLGLDQVDAGNVAVDSLGRHYAITGRQKAFGGVDEFLRNDAVLQNLLFPVDVPQEAVQGIHPLPQALFEIGKFLVANDPGDGVKGEQLLLEFAVFVDAEFHAVAGQQLIDRFTVRNESIHRLLPPYYEKALLPHSEKAPLLFTKVFYHRGKILSTVGPRLKMPKICRFLPENE